MTVNHDAVAALPTSGSAVKSLLRSLVTARMPYVLADSDDSRNLIATDPSTGAIIVDLMLLGRVFHYDPTDTTTAHDGTSCLVSSDGLRYKLALGSDVFAYAVLDNIIATPPVSPTLGDAYLVAAAATGAWSGKSNYIAVKTNRGWEFVNFSIGRFIYVESVDTYYHKNAGGSWVTGFGNQTVIANSVPLSAAINFGKRLIVENQTTTAPPGSPTVGTAYIIGPSATGGWSGLDGKIAICEVAGSFVIYTPTNGWEAYDKAKNNSVTFNGSAWASTVGAFVGYAYQFTQDITGTSVVGSGSYGAYNTTVGPVNPLRRLDGTFLTYQAKRTGAPLRFTYQALINASFPGGSNNLTLALYQDSIATAIAWDCVVFNAGLCKVSTVFVFSAPDAASHVYKIAVVNIDSPNGSNSIEHRLFEVMEGA